MLKKSQHSDKKGSEMSDVMMVAMIMIMAMRAVEDSEVNDSFSSFLFFFYSCVLMEIDMYDHNSISQSLCKPCSKGRNFVSEVYASSVCPILSKSRFIQVQCDSPVFVSQYSYKP